MPRVPEGIAAAAKGIFDTFAARSGTLGGRIINGTLKTLGTAAAVVSGADAVLNFGMYFARVRLAFAQANERDAAIKQELEYDRIRRVDGLIDDIVTDSSRIGVGKNKAERTARAQALAEVWKPVIVDKMNKQGLLGITLPALEHMPTEQAGGFDVLTHQDSRKVADLLERYLVDGLADPQTPTAQAAEFLQDTNFVQSQRVRGFIPRANLFNALVYLTINNMNQALAKEGLDERRRAIIPAHIANFTSIAKQLNGTKWWERGPLRKVVHWGNIQYLVQEMENFAVKELHDVINPAQMETITALAENLKVPSWWYQLRHKGTNRGLEQRLRATELRDKFETELKELEITPEEAPVVDQARRLVAPIMAIASSNRSEGNGEMSTTIFSPIKRARRAWQFAGTVNDMTRAYQKNHPDVPRESTSLWDRVQLAGAVFLKAKAVQAPDTETYIAQTMLQLMKEGADNVIQIGRQEAVGREKTWAQNARTWVVNQIVPHLPGYQQWKFLFDQFRPGQYIPLPSVPGE